MAALPIYLDYNATTPHDPEVIATMRVYLESHFGNPSSAHIYGQNAHRAVERAREQVAHLLSCEPREVLFTSGGTESNNHALKGIAFARRSRGNHILTSQIEHPAVTEVCAFLKTQGFDVTYVPVDDSGRVRVGDVAAAIRPETILISVMHANNEVGTIQPIEEIAALARARGIVVHTDAAQSIGKAPVDVNALGVDLLSMAGHKLYAPKGIGVLYIREGIELEKFMHGAGHESGRRAGTENVLEIVGLGKACELIAHDLDAQIAHCRMLRDRLEKGLVEGVPDVCVNGYREHRLPNTLSISFKDVLAGDVLDAIDDVVAASAGSACHSGTVSVSHVLAAMGIPIEWAKGTLRLSVGRFTTLADIDCAVKTIGQAVISLRDERDVERISKAIANVVKTLRNS